MFLMLVTAPLVISCAGPQNGKPTAQNQSEPLATEEKVSSGTSVPIVYGKPGPDMIGVYVGGPGCDWHGIYYFKSGTTLGQALQVAEYNDFGFRLRVYNIAEGASSGKNYKVRHLNDAEKARVLRDKDYLYFPCTLP